MPIFTFRDPWSDPFREMQRLQRQMERLFQESVASGPAGWRSGVYPLVNISEDHDHLYVRAELPGIDPNKLEITIHERNLILRGERQIPPEGKDVNYHRREREAGFFRRVMALSSPVNPDSVEATYQNGILTIKMAKPEETKPRKITVKTGKGDSP